VSLRIRTSGKDRIIAKGYIPFERLNAVPCRLGVLCGLTFPEIDVRFAGKHVRPGALAGIADERVPLHIANDGMRRHRHVHHTRSALRANRIGSDDIGR
jgi:hypothetical protein